MITRHSVPRSRPSSVSSLFLCAAAGVASLSTVAEAGAAAAGVDTSRVWVDVDKQTLSRGIPGRSIAFDRYRTVALYASELSSRLSQAPLEFSERAGKTEVVLELPWPTGGFRRFRIEESPIMEPDLAAQLPEVKTYRGQGALAHWAPCSWGWSTVPFASAAVGS